MILMCQSPLFIFLKTTETKGMLKHNSLKFAKKYVNFSNPLQLQVNVIKF